jgi:hypothetical protein
LSRSHQDQRECTGAHFSGCGRERKPSDRFRVKTVIAPH